MLAPRAELRADLRIDDRLCPAVGEELDRRIAHLLAQVVPGFPRIARRVGREHDLLQRAQPTGGASGSSSNTSSAAPASRPPFSASTSAASSTTGPRLVLTNSASVSCAPGPRRRSGAGSPPRAARAPRRNPTAASRSSNVAGSTSRALNLLCRQHRVIRQHAQTDASRAPRADALPMRPRPTMPSVCPRSRWIGYCATPPASVRYACHGRAEARAAPTPASSASACSATSSVPYVGAFATAMPRAVAAGHVDLVVADAPADDQAAATATRP